MRRAAIAFFFILIYLQSGLNIADAQPRLERISIVERADSRGYVLRYHLTEMVQNYRILRPDESTILMELSSPGFSVAGIIPVTQLDLIHEIELIELKEGVGIVIHLNEGVYFLTDTYPDINEIDVLLSIETSTRNAVLQQVVTSEYFDWFNSIEEEIETRPSEEPVVHEITPEIPRTVRRPGIRFGAMAGVSSSNVFASDFISETRYGISFGLTSDISIPLDLPYQIKTGVETGVFFSQKGFQNPDPQFLSGVVFEFDYIEVPVLGKISYDVVDLVSGYVLFGPSVGFMVNAERVRSDDERRDLDDRTKPLDFSVVAGAGIDLTFFDTIFFGQIRSSFGASNVFKDEPEIRDLVRFRHRSLSLVAGIRF